MSPQPATRLPVRPASAAVGPAGTKPGLPDLVRLSLVAQIIIGLSGIQVILGPLNALRPGLTLILVTCFAIVRTPSSVRWRNLTASQPKAVAVLVVLAVGSALFGLSFGGSARAIIDGYSRTLVLFVLMTVAIRHVRDLTILMWSYVLSIAIVFILSITVMEMVDAGALDRLETNAAGYDANDLGMLFLIAIPLAIFFFYNSRRVGRVVALFVTIAAPVGLAMTGSRGAMVGLAVVGPLLLVSLDRIALSRRVGTLAVVLVALFLGAPDGYWRQMSTILSADEDYNATAEYGRLAIARRGLSYMMRYPAFGVGISNFRRAEGTISPLSRTLESRGENLMWVAPHNTYVQIGAEMGVFALALWLALLYSGTFGLSKLRRQLGRIRDPADQELRFLRDACLFMPISVTAFGVTSFFLSHAYTLPFYILLALVTGIHLLGRARLRSGEGHHRQHLRRSPSGAV